MGGEQAAYRMAAQALGRHPCFIASCQVLKEALVDAPTAAFTDAPVPLLHVEPRDADETDVGQPESPSAANTLLDFSELPAHTIVMLALNGPIGVRCNGPNFDGLCGLGRVTCNQFT
ncbi:MAG TPA: hypothetical protein VLF60_02970 [Candidatus Saccharimonadales bacterium]|nr:hypothetical protein [Candidatus Saccharimonadales bacterium]